MPSTVQVTGFGMTETGGSVVLTSPSEPVETRLASEGAHFPGMEIVIKDVESGKRLAAGERGEICIRGPQVFKGYFKAPEKNAESFDAEGFFLTGDLGMLDDEGRLHYLGRAKDMLKVGGENVAAIEIESFLSTHPAVSIAQVVGVPDDRYVEVPAAFIELKPGHTATEEEIIAFCDGEMARFKVPRYVRFVSEWPMSATKVQKFKLRDVIVAEWAS
jgi:acyl-CoA synthetase (AMP-forming)/AMP-acid ligase II